MNLMVPNEPNQNLNPTSLPCLLNSLRTKISAQCPEIKECMLKHVEHLSHEQRNVVLSCWDAFNNSTDQQRDLILTGILLRCSINQLSYVSNCLQPLLKVDFISKLPRELSLKILSYLDAKSLVQASSVSKVWKSAAEDDLLWRTLCDQHINKKCTKCGWGLPLLLDDYLKRKKVELMTSTKRSREYESPESPPNSIQNYNGYPSQKIRLDHHMSVKSHVTSSPVSTGYEIKLDPRKSFWKFIYRDRLSIERNWRRGKFFKKSINVHLSGVHCHQSNQDIIIAATYSPNLEIFNLKTGKKIRTLTGHFAAVRDLYFDDVRLVTASHDNTVRIWCYREGLCKRIIPAPGAQCLHFEKDYLAVGLASGSIHIWNFRKTTRHSLVGHTDSVTKVRVFKETFLLSSSDDGTVRLWNIETLECIRVFQGHTSSVTCFQFSIPNLFPVSELMKQNLPVPESPTRSPSPPYNSRCDDTLTNGTSLSTLLSANIPNPTHSQLHRAPLLVTGSADNTLRVWSLQTGKCLRQSFGHLGEITCLDMDSLRIVSGSMDGCIKVWDLDSGRCMHTMFGDESGDNDTPPPPMLCASLTDTRIIAGSQNGKLYLWDCSSDSHPACSLNALLSPSEPDHGWAYHLN
ncbi:WD40 repeat-like protein [Neoconidiobolus thromboides FSU 785]|nr:WD40 repeat-like protein [Neoconidiobolus thromboides FSU 785]